MNGEREINIKTIIYQVLKQWRKVVIAGIVTAVIVGAYKLYTGIKIYYDPVKYNEVYDAYIAERNDHVATGETLKASMENIHVNQERQEEYNKNSVLMKINPMNEYVGSFDIYIDSGYQINPELAYQNTDITERLISAYKSYMVNGELYGYILENTPQISEVRYLTEILSINANSSASTISIEVKNVDETSGSELLNIIRRGVEGKYAEISEAIGEHTYKFINESGYLYVDLELDKQQKDNINYVSELSNQLGEQSEEYKKWKSTSEPKFDYSMNGIARSVIKFVIIGGIVGAFIWMFILAFIAIITDKVISGKEIKCHMAVNIIGELPVKNKKKRCFRWIDKWFYGIGEVTLKSNMYNEYCKIIVNRVEAMLGDNADKHISLIGNIDINAMNELAAGMKGKCEIDVAGDIFSDSDAVVAAREANNIIIIAKKGETTYTNIADELEYLRLWGKEPLGIIVTEADVIC